MSIKYKKVEPKDEIDKILYKYFINVFRTGYIEIGDNKYLMPELYTSIADDIENFEVEDTDIWLTSYPKSGTTWSQEMIWMIINNLDFEGAKEALCSRFPFLEFKCIFDVENTVYHHIYDNSVETCKNMSKIPRMIKTHLPFDLLPKEIRNKTKKPKIIHVTRNPKDACVSFYHHCRLLEGYTGNFEDYCKLFLKGRISWTPYWKNILSYWNRKDEYDILIIRYEDMKKDLRSVILQVAQYLDKTLTEEQVMLLKDHLSFEKMKQNKSVNYEEFTEEMKKINKVEGHFMRSGTVDGYKAEMSEELIQKFDKWIEENTAGLNYF